MNKIINYEIIDFTNLDETVKYVKRGLSNGWQPYGELKMTIGGEPGAEKCSYVQVMVLREGDQE